MVGLCPTIFLLDYLLYITYIILMTTIRPYAYNTGSTIDGTTQIGYIAVGMDEMDYSSNPGDVKWWMGPDEDPGVVICVPVPEYNHPTPVGNIGGVQFWRSKTPSSNEILSIINMIARRKGQSNFTNMNDAANWLTLSGYSASWQLVNTPVKCLSVIENSKLYGLIHQGTFRYAKRTQIGIISNFDI